MALQLGALRDALIEAGASEEKAQRAAEELAGYDTEFVTIRREMDAGFSAVRREMDAGFAAVRREMDSSFAEVNQRFAQVDQRFAQVDQRFVKVQGDINLLRWMAGTNLVLTLAVLGSMFALWAKVGEITGQLAQVAARLH